MGIRNNMKHRGCLRGMLAALVLTLFCSAGLSAQVREMKIDLPGGEMTYRDVFARIEAQNDVWFGYAVEDVDTNTTVTLPHGETQLGSLLDLLFDGTEYKYTISGRHILVRRDETPAPPAVEKSYPPLRTYSPYEKHLPRIVLKSNMLWDLTTTLNIGAEFYLTPKWTLDIPINYNGWKFGDDTRLRHWAVQPEARYWFCESFNGWFVGAHAHYAKFNIGGMPDFIFSENMQKNRYQGDLYGAGISGGYAWILKNRWSMEVNAGVGYARINTTKYPCAVCGTPVTKSAKNYFGPTRIGLTLIYVIK